MFDAPLGYHQLMVTLSIQKKLAFQGPDAIKWTYTVMPFGPTNGLAMFISFVYNVNIQWILLATKPGISIDEDTSTRIIVDDIVSNNKDMETVLVYMECQFCTCLAHRLLLDLKKSHIFPQPFEFVGNDVCPDGNHPAQSKNKLLSKWPNPGNVHNISKFISFAQFWTSR